MRFSPWKKKHLGNMFVQPPLNKSKRMLAGHHFGRPGISTGYPGSQGNDHEKKSSPLELWMKLKPYLKNRKDGRLFQKMFFFHGLWTPRVKLYMPVASWGVESKWSFATLDRCEGSEFRHPRKIKDIVHRWKSEPEIHNMLYIFLYIYFFGVGKNWPLLILPV